MTPSVLIRGSQNATGQPCRKVFPGQPWETREPAAKEPAATAMAFIIIICIIIIIIFIIVTLLLPGV